MAAEEPEEQCVKRDEDNYAISPPNSPTFGVEKCDVYLFNYMSNLKEDRLTLSEIENPVELNNEFGTFTKKNE